MIHSCKHTSMLCGITVLHMHTLYGDRVLMHVMLFKGLGGDPVCTSGQPVQLQRLFEPAGTTVKLTNKQTRSLGCVQSTLTHTHTHTHKHSSKRCSEPHTTAPKTSFKFEQRRLICGHQLHYDDSSPCALHGPQ